MNIHCVLEIVSKPNSLVFQALWFVSCHIYVFLYSLTCTEINLTSYKQIECWRKNIFVSTPICIMVSNVIFISDYNRAV